MTNKGDVEHSASLIAIEAKQQNAVILSKNEKKGQSG